jgi:Protein of unknown function (DUF3455)
MKMLRRVFALALIAYSIVLIQAKQSPPSIDPPAGTALLLQAAGEGSQVYSCTDGHWTLKAPEAKLLDGQGQVIGTHFAGPTWRLMDGSEIKGKAIANRPAPDASSVPWLLLQAVEGSGSGKLANVVYIRRTETQGGIPGTSPCTSGEERVHYKATYSFYTAK